MSFNITKIKKFFTSPTINENSEIQPEIGFKLTYFEQTKQLVVKVIGARHLPTIYGNIKPQGYLVKVRVYPGRDKYETEIAKESWPTFNQDLLFDLQPTCRVIKDQFQGKFVTLTVYAVLETHDRSTKLKRSNSLRKSFRYLIGKEESVEVRNKNAAARYSSNRFTFNNRRTIGAVTYNLDPRNFAQKHHLTYSTPDIWRGIQNITSGIDYEKKETKCNLEVALAYYNSEDGNNDRIQVSLSKLRCGMQTMHQHEKYGGSLYLKIVAFECGVRVRSWKSDRFKPTISMKIEPTTATLQAIFKNYNLKNMKIVIRMLCKNLLEKKVLLGKIEIDSDSAIFHEAVDSPSTIISKTIDLE